MIRQIVQDFAVLEDNRIIQDDDKFLVVKTVIAYEIVHKYQRGIAYKPAYPTNFSPGSISYRGKTFYGGQVTLEGVVYFEP